MTLPVIVPSLLCAAAAAAALAYALRGRRVNDHPVCRKCGFDLFGKPEGATVCSECGADLSRPRAVRVGRREKRRGLLRAAAALLVVSLGLLGVQVWAVARGVDWQRHKPAWWLAREAAAVDTATRDAALAELSRRIGDGSLDRGREEALVQKALAHQADWNQPWVPAWGALVEAARRSGRLSHERWDNYLTHAVPFTLAPAQPAYRRAHEVELKLNFGPMRVAAARAAVTKCPVALYYDETVAVNDRSHGVRALPGLRWGGIGVPHPMPGLVPVCYRAEFVTGWTQAHAWPRIEPEAMRQMPDGRQVTRLSLVLVPATSSARDSLSYNVHDLRGAPRTTVPLETVWTLLPDAPTDDGAAVRAAVKEGLAVGGVKHHWDTRLGRKATGRYSCEIACNSAPVDLVYKVAFRWHYADAPPGAAPSEVESVYAEPVHFAKGGAGQRVKLEFRAARAVSMPLPRAVAVVLTPWPAAAPAHVAVIGGGEVVRRHVPVYSVNDRYRAGERPQAPR